MASYVLIPGAASDSWYWHRVVPLLEAAGHDVVAADVPCDDETATFDDYAEAVVAAVRERGIPLDEVVVVAQSLGGFTAPLVCERLPVHLVVLVAAMVPTAGESGGAWWANTGQADAQRAFAIAQGRDPDDEDPLVLFLNEVPADVVAESANHVRGQSGRCMEDPFPLERWPDVPTRFLLCRDDRLFPPEFQRRVVHERLGIEPDELPGGHAPALAHPDELVERLEAYRAELVPPQEAPTGGA